MRVGAFLRQLCAWSEKPCVLTIRTAAVGTEVRTAGILRPYFSLSSLHGWALVPPQQHGGFTSLKLSELPIAEASHRDVLIDVGGPRLRFTACGGEIVLELERDDVILTAPPRVVRNGRYLYIGGRRRRRAEAWMLQ